MTLKYESEILFDLMKRDGDDAPSDVLPYESVLKEKYLEQVEGAYPKLQDYRSEWLNYNLVAHQPADFPIETLSNVTRATVDNVVPYAYRSAILKGSTKYRDIDTGEFLETFEEGRNLELVSVKMPGLITSNNGCYIINIEKNCYYTAGEGKFSPSDNFDTYNVYVEGVDTIKIECDTELSDVSFWDNTKHYISGDFNISYSISVPSNTKYFKVAIRHGNTNFIVNGFDVINDIKTNILTTSEEVELRGIGDVQDKLDLLTGELVQRTGKFMVDGTEDFGWYGNKGETLYELNIYKSSIVGKLNNEVDDSRPSLCSTLEYCGTTMYGQPGTGFAITGGSESAFLQIVLQKEKLSDTTLDGIKQYLSENPLYFVVPLLDKSIKTVELTVTDQDGNTKSIIKPIEGTMHIMTNGTPIKPTVTTEVPVEAITQNLSSFIKE